MQLEHAEGLKVVFVIRFLHPRHQNHLPCQSFGSLVCRCFLARPSSGRHLNLQFGHVGSVYPRAQTSLAYRLHLNTDPAMCPYHQIHLLVSIILESGTFALWKYFQLIQWHSTTPGLLRTLWQIVPLSYPILLTTFPASA